MEEILSIEFYHNSLKVWLIAAGFILGSIIFSRLIVRLCELIVKLVTSRTKTNLDDLVVSTLKKPLSMLIIIIGFRLALTTLTLPNADVHEFLSKSITVVATLASTWMVSRVAGVLLDEYSRRRSASGDDQTSQFVPVICKALKTVIWIFGAITALNNSGYDVNTLIAGLGIGSLALAMAAKDTASNFFGGATIMIDKPFKKGERICVGGYDGFVDSLGIRSFRLRTLSGTIVTIPNSKIIDSMVENISLEPSRKVTVKLGLTYDTTPEQMEAAMQTLHRIAADNAGVEDNELVFFDSFGDFALSITLIYFIRKEADIFATQSDINMAILKQFNQQGLSFAFPTQTLYVEKNMVQNRN